MKYEFIGWCHQDNHDKVWVLLHLGEKQFAAIWGRRGKKLQAKINSFNNREYFNLIDSKINKGYHRVDRSKLDSIYPEFEQDLEQTAVWALLKNGG